MNQWEIHELLKQHRRKWFSTNQLSEITGMQQGQLYPQLRKMRQFGLVHFATKTGPTNEVFMYKFRELKQ